MLGNHERPPGVWAFAVAQGPLMMAIFMVLYPLPFFLGVIVTQEYGLRLLLKFMIPFRAGTGDSVTGVAKGH